MNKPKLPLGIERVNSLDWPYTKISDANRNLLGDDEIEWVLSVLNSQDGLINENERLKASLKVCMEKLDLTLGPTGCANVARSLLNELNSSGEGD